jgi:molybdopterin-guanine dinucleotide biosynthesis protein A
MPSFSAVLLAGGQSTRMGRDKALLPAPGSDLLLWRRQLHTLEELNPEELFWSGPPRPELPPELRPVADEAEKAGPLAGISACLQLLHSDLLVVLAIDLPYMNAAFLKSLLTRCAFSRGAVGRHGGFFEPLAAVYPKELRPLAVEHLAQKRFAMQDLIREALSRGLLEAFPLGEKDVPLFKNLNYPDDLSA